MINQEKLSITENPESLSSEEIKKELEKLKKETIKQLKTILNEIDNIS